MGVLTTALFGRTSPAADAAAESRDSPRKIRTWLGLVSWPGATRANSSSRLVGFSTMPVTVKTRSAAVPAGRDAPGRADAEAVKLGDPGRDRHLPRPGRVTTGVEREQHLRVRRGRVLGAQVGAAGLAGGDRLVVDDARRPVCLLDLGDDARQVGRVTRQLGQRRGGAEGPRVGRARRRRGDRDAEQRRGRGDRDQQHDQDPLLPLAQRQAHRPAGQRAAGHRRAARVLRLPDRPVVAFVPGHGHDGCSSSVSGPAGAAVWSATRPSRRNTTRSAQEASCASWVTTTAAVPRLQ